MMLCRACSMVTSVLYPLLVREHPWSVFSTCMPCTRCRLQVAIVADGSVVPDLIRAAPVVTHMDCPCAGHNLKRAFQKSLLLHAVIYFMLFIFSAHLLLGANNMRKPLPETLHADAHFMRLHN